MLLMHHLISLLVLLSTVVELHSVSDKIFFNAIADEMLSDQTFR